MSHSSRMVTVPDILFTILAYGGIKCTENPSFYAWKVELGIERQIEIKTVDQLVKNLTKGVYQIYVKNPEISGIDPAVFKINSLSITIAYEGDGVWGQPEIQTVEEEIPPEYEQDFSTKALARANKIASKVREGMSLVVKIYDIARSAGGFFSGSGG